MFRVSGPGHRWELPARSGDLQRVCQKPPRFPGKLLRTQSGVRGFLLLILILSVYTLHKPILPGTLPAVPSHSAPWVCLCCIPIPFPACHTVAVCVPPTFSLQREKCCPNSTQFSPGMQLWSACMTGSRASRPLCEHTRAKYESVHPHQVVETPSKDRHLGCPGLMSCLSSPSLAFLSTSSFALWPAAAKLPHPNILV